MSKIRVLVVDDSIFMRTIIRDMLEKDGRIEVIGTAFDGLDALKKIEDLSPDLITLDIEMPRMDGLEVLERLRSRASSPKTLILSSLTTRDAEMTRRALTLGADDFMFKPKDIQKTRGIERELLAKIENLIHIPVCSRPDSERGEPADTVVVIGSSAGGPPMLDRLLSSVPPSLPAALVITQHMPPGFTAPLAERLSKVSRLPVKESDNGDILERGRAVVSRSGFHTMISSIAGGHGEVGGKIIHTSSPPIHSVRPAVDLTFSSASRVFSKRTISVLLSGMGKDGGEGMMAVKEAGGVTMVCDQKDCLVYGMARSALDKGCVEHVVPLRDLPGEIARVAAEMEG